MELSSVLKNTSRYCYNVPMKFLITYETFKSPFNLVVRCSLRMDYSEKCMGECLKPNEIDSIETFTLKFPKCPKGSECEPKYAINILKELSIIPRSIPSEATSILPVQLEFKNNGRTPIYFPKISILCNQYTSILTLFAKFSFTPTTKKTTDIKIGFKLSEYFINKIRLACYQAMIFHSDTIWR
ncbi:hypothetical protein MXB_4385 [Myxobolus squamalis]|nr:hypothetical protein MXB_4385 [Myxobolus squamalis]